MDAVLDTTELVGIPLLAALEPSELAQVAPLVCADGLQAGHEIFKQGDPARFMWVVGRGCEIVVSTVPAGATEAVDLATLGPGETVGEVALLEACSHTATARVTRDGRVYRIDGAGFSALRARRESAAYKILRAICTDLCARVRHTTKRLPSVDGAGDDGGDRARRDAAVHPSSAALNDFVPFQRLAAEHRAMLAPLLWEQQLAAGQVLVREGEPGESVFLLVSGRIELRTQGTTVHRLRSGAIFGLVSALRCGLRTASCFAVEPSRVWRLRATDFDALLAQGHQFAFWIVELTVRELLARLRATNAVLLETAAVRTRDLEVELFGDLDFLDES